jgi:hypothetical protein
MGENDSAKDEVLDLCLKRKRQGRENAARPFLDGTKPIADELRRANKHQWITWAISGLTLIITIITLAVTIKK